MLALDVVLPMPPVLPIVLNLLQAFPLCFRDEKPTEDQGNYRKQSIQPIRQSIAEMPEK